MLWAILSIMTFGKEGSHCSLLQDTKPKCRILHGLQIICGCGDHSIVASKLICIQNYKQTVIHMQVHSNQLHNSDARVGQGLDSRLVLWTPPPCTPLFQNSGENTTVQIVAEKASPVDRRQAGPPKLSPVPLQRCCLFYLLKGTIHRSRTHQ